MEQNLHRQIKLLTDKALRYVLLLDGTQQALKQQPDNPFLQMRVAVLEENLGVIVDNLQELLRQLTYSSDLQKVS